MESRIVFKNNCVAIEINGKQYTFAATRSFRPEGKILKQFSDHGLKFFNIFPSGIMTALQKRTVPYSQFGPVWVGINQYNWENLRAQCDEVFGSISEDTFVSVNVHLDPPQWFVDSHPGFVDHWEQMIQNLGSDEWKKAASDYMCALIDKLDEWYPNRVYAIFLMCGGTTEWYSYHLEKCISEPTEIHKNAYKNYCKDPTIEIPSPEVLHSATDGVIRSKANQKDAVRYWEFVNTIVPDTMLYFAKIAKEHTKRSRLVGLFTAHIYGMNLDFAVQTSYNCVDKLLESNDIDMIFCPASYMCRRMESTSAIRVAIDSLSCHKKLFSHEIDSATHLLKKVNNAAAAQHAGFFDNVFTCGSDSINYIKREVGMILAKGQGYWWFDMFSGYYDDPQLLSEIEKLKNIQYSLLERDNSSLSEVCQMLDKESNYYLKTKSYYPMTEHQSEALSKAGTPWNQNMTYDFDCENFNEEQYKLYMFPALFAPSEKTIEKIQSLRKSGKNMLYLHAPYYAVDENLSTEPMEKYTGIKFEKCELNDNTIRLCFDGNEHITYDFRNKTLKGDVWYHSGDEQVKPIFSPTNLDVVLGRFEENGKPACGIKFREDGGFDAFSACAPIPVELIKEIYRYANIFMYTNKNIPVYTNASFECVYSYEGGDVDLFRKEDSILTDCFTGEKYEVGPKKTTIRFSPHETKFFYVDKKDS